MREEKDIKRDIEGAKRCYKHYTESYAWHNRSAAREYWLMLEERRRVYALEKELRELEAAEQAREGKG